MLCCRQRYWVLDWVRCVVGKGIGILIEYTCMMCCRPMDCDFDRACCAIDKEIGIFIERVVLWTNGLGF